MACPEISLIGRLISLAHDDWLHEFGITLQQLPVVLFSKDRGRKDPTVSVSGIRTRPSPDCFLFLLHPFSINHNSLVGTWLVTCPVAIGVFNLLSVCQGPLCRGTVQVQALTDPID
jgi:hypothetical protein